MAEIMPFKYECEKYPVPHRKYLEKDGGEDMPTLSEIFDKRKILLYQNESLDLDHYYQEPYQDENDEIKEMGKPFETDESKKIRSLDLISEDRTYSGFSYFMDGSRRTYKIGDMVLEGIRSGDK